eukprot:2405982-Rhodomonas_salina.1
MLGFVPFIASLMLSASHDPSQRPPRCPTAVHSLFRDPDVRDLAWAAFSPSLFSQDAIDVLDGAEADQLLGLRD